MPNNIAIQYHKTPFGELILGSYQNDLCLCDWRFRKMRSAIDKRVTKGLEVSMIEGPSELIDETKHQLKQYFEAKRTVFDIPLLMIGTEFQKQVWTELLKIPFGSTSSYLALSQNLGNEKAIRAVATANGANAISIIIPCHRVIGQDGSLVGYAGGLPAKQNLLQLEKSNKEKQLMLF